MDIDYRKGEREWITLDDEQMEKLKARIKELIRPEDYTKSIGDQALSSYAWKHIIEAFTEDFTEHGYVSNIDFKEAMKQLGVKNSNSSVQNPRYPISSRCTRRLSKQSRELKRARRRRENG